MVVFSPSAIIPSLFFSLLPSPLRSTLFPYTTLFRSQVYLAQFSMSNDGAATGDPLLAWPGDLTAVPPDLQTYINKERKSTRLNSSHVRNSYSALSANLTLTVAAGPPDTVTFTGGTAA